MLLDEIGELSPALQAKLLRVLQEREFERVGESVSARIDVRVIAATNSDLGKMVREGAFREDLFYRINVIPVRLPPLRERREDVPLLVQHFCDRIGRDLDPPRQGVSFSQRAVRQLMAYEWPGNVRQLENFVERAMTLSAGRQWSVGASQTAVSVPQRRDKPGRCLRPEAGWLAKRGRALRVYSRWLPPDIDGGSMQPSATPAQPDTVAAAVATRK